MTDIPLNAKVFCTDGEAGVTTAVIIDPIKQNITHVVVSHDYEELIVPLDQIVETSPESLTLSCTTAELAQMPPFTDVHFIDGGGYYPDYMDSAWASPYVTTYPAEDLPIVEEILPAGELAIHRGDPVAATDGQVGHVGEFVVDANSGHITHLVLRAGHFWGKHDVTIDLKLVDKVKEGIVYLNVDKKTVEQLPSVKVKRHYPWEKE
jgi:sporulation protein YlmC with PRC-barrel domain